MVIDDVGMESVSKAVNYFLNYPCYGFLGGVPLSDATASRKLFNKYLINATKGVSKIVPSKVRKEIFSGKILKRQVLGYSVVAMQKIEDDNRPWNWYETF